MQYHGVQYLDYIHRSRCVRILCIQVHVCEEKEREKESESTWEAVC